MPELMRVEVYMENGRPAALSGQIFVRCLGSPDRDLEGAFERVPATLSWACRPSPQPQSAAPPRVRKKRAPTVPLAPGEVTLVSLLREILARQPETWWTSRELVAACFESGQRTKGRVYGTGVCTALAHLVRAGEVERRRHPGYERVTQWRWRA